MKFLHLLALGMLGSAIAHAEEQCLLSRAPECEVRQERKTSAAPAVNLAVYRAPRSTASLLDSAMIVSGRHASVPREARVLFSVARF